MENETKTNESTETKHPLMFLSSEKILNYTSCVVPGQDAGRRRVGRDESSGHFSLHRELCGLTATPVHTASEPMFLGAASHCNMEFSSQGKKTTKENNPKQNVTCLSVFLGHFPLACVMRRFS